MTDDPYDLSDEMKSLTDIQKIAVVQWAMKHIVDHAREGGSYRYLIYTRMGFGMEAYAPLCSDGITISNEFDLNIKDKLIEALKANDTKKLKNLLGLCDDCFNYASVWDNGKALCTHHHKEET